MAVTVTVLHPICEIHVNVHCLTFDTIPAYNFFLIRY